MTTLLLIEHPVAVRRAIRESLLHDVDLQIVGEAGRIEQAARLAHSLRPDVILLDAEMPGLMLAAAVEMLQARSPESALVVLTLEPDLLDRRGVGETLVDIVSKLAGPATLRAAIRRAARRHPGGR